MKAKQVEIWIAVFAAEYVRLRATGILNTTTLAEEAGRVADLAVRAYTQLEPRPALVKGKD
jgi:hypothetical protein